MKSFCLASGSGGNCWYIESKNGVRILVDCGLSYLKIKEILKSKNIDINLISAIFITHEHSDHISGLDVLLKNLNIKLYCSKNTFKNFLKIKNCVISNEVIFLKNHDYTKIKDLNIFSVEKPHDAEESLSFIFENDNKKLAIITDLGHIPNYFIDILKKCDILYFETNYCDIKIKEKKDNLNERYLHRLMSDYGHLSITQACSFFEKICNNNQKIILSHISENTNSYENAYIKVKFFLESKNLNPKIYVSFQNKSTDWF